jgi:hypothetical protein
MVDAEASSTTGNKPVLKSTTVIELETPVSECGVRIQQYVFGDGNIVPGKPDICSRFRKDRVFGSNGRKKRTILDGQKTLYGDDVCVRGKLGYSESLKDDANAGIVYELVKEFNSRRDASVPYELVRLTEILKENGSRMSYAALLELVSPYGYSDRFLNHCMNILESNRFVKKCQPR